MNKELVDQIYKAHLQGVTVYEHTKTTVSCVIGILKSIKKKNIPIHSMQIDIAILELKEELKKVKDGQKKQST